MAQLSATTRSQVKLPLAVAAAVISWATPLAGQRPSGIFRGQVTDSLFEPVKFAEINILGVNLRALADSLGLFRIEGVPVGVHPVVVRSIGWKPLFFMIKMEADQEQIARVGLERSPQRLPDLVTKGGRFAKPPEYAFTTRYDDFFRRRAFRSGTFRTRNDALFQSAFHTGELLRGIPGVIVRNGIVGPSVEFTNCGEAYAKVSVWIDGAEVMNDNHNEALEYIRPGDIEMIEVYRRMGQIPGEFLGNSCAAVVIWTR